MGSQRSSEWGKRRERPEGGWRRGRRRDVVFPREEREREELPTSSLLYPLSFRRFVFFRSEFLLRRGKDRTRPPFVPSSQTKNDPFRNETFFLRERIRPNRRRASRDREEEDSTCNDEEGRKTKIQAMDGEGWEVGIDPEGEGDRDEWTDIDERDRGYRMTWENGGRRGMGVCVWKQGSVGGFGIGFRASGRGRTKRLE